MTTNKHFGDGVDFAYLAYGLSRTLLSSPILSAMRLDSDVLRHA